MTNTEARFPSEDPNPADTAEVVLDAIKHFISAVGKDVSVGVLLTNPCDLIPPFWVRQALRDLHRTDYIVLSDRSAPNDATIKLASPKEDISLQLKLSTVDRLHALRGTGESIDTTLLRVLDTYASVKNFMAQVKGK